MNKGEYIGKDGRTYRWIFSSIMGWVVRDEGLTVTGVKPGDWPAAKSALDELIEEEAEEWVEIDGFHRCDITGKHQQVRSCTRDGWSEVCMGEDYDVFNGYRKGRAVALEPVQRMIWFFDHEIHWMVAHDEPGWVTVCREDWDTLTTLAEKVQL
jgi:hypothetical protein